MRISLIILFILFLAKLCPGQEEEDFKSFFDGSNVQVKIVFCNSSGYRTLELSKEATANWEYKRDYPSYEKHTDSGRKYAEPGRAIDWDRWESELETIITQNLPDQNKILQKSKIKKSEKKRFFNQIMDGTWYVLSYTYKGEERTIWYNNPHSYLGILRSMNLPTKEHEVFVRFIEYVYDDFEIEELHKLQKKELMEMAEIAKNKAIETQLKDEN